MAVKWQHVWAYGSVNAMTAFPQLCACLWSYDVDQLDVECDRELIIRSVLNYGTLEAVR